MDYNHVCNTSEVPESALVEDQAGQGFGRDGKDCFTQGCPGVVS